MGIPQLEHHVLSFSRAEQFRLLGALESYYSHFGTPKSKTFNQAAHEARVNPARLIYYMFEKKEYRMGMPETGDDAKEFLHGLRRLLADLRSPQHFQ